jgi:hypothetical protein
MGEPPDPAQLGGALLRNGRLDGTDRSRDVLEEANRAWQSLAEERETRRRNRDYLFNEQWNETITTPDGETKTEEEAIREEGREPWQMNRVRPIIRNLKGQLRQNESDRQVFSVNREDTEAANVMTQALREARKINRLHSLEAQQFMEHLLAAKAAFRVGYKYVPEYDRPEVVVRAVNSLRLFYNKDLDDRRGRNLRIIGELHDLEVREIKDAFAPRDPELAEAIGDYYGTGDTRTFSGALSGFNQHDGLNFRTPTSTDLGRVIEVWRRESRQKRIVHDHDVGKLFDVTGEMDEADIQRENRSRQKLGIGGLEEVTRREAIWVGYFLTPTGEILWAGETPYAHQKHPYVMGFADFLDGEAVALMDDLIDQQRLYNRMIQVLDVAMSTSARGTLMIPEQMIPDGMSPEEFSREYTKVNGVVIYDATTESGEPMPSGHVPEQVFANSVPAGSFEWLQQMSREMKSASGVMGPQLGEETNANTPAALYNQQITQSQTTNLDQFETYFETLHDLDLKIVKVAASNHSEGRRIRGDADEGVLEFSEDQIQDLEFGVSLAEVTDTATYRQLFEQDLKEFLGGGLLTFRQFLKESAHPKAESLLELIERTNPLVQDESDSPADAQGEAQQSSAEQEVRQAAQQMQGAGAGEPNEQSQRQLRAELIQAAEDGNQRAQALLAQAA